VSWLQTIRYKVHGKPGEVASYATTSALAQDQPIVEDDFELDADKSHQVFVASQWKLTWWKFRKHKLALASALIIAGFYLVALFAEFIAPYNPEQIKPSLTYAPPQTIHIFGPDGLTRPYVYGLKTEIDPVALRRTFVLDPSKQYELRFFVRGAPYKFWGLLDTNIHLFGTSDPNQQVYLLGADRLGRDLFSRTVYGARISLSIGLIGVLMSLVLGVALGGISGYYGGTADSLIQRLIEFLRSIPTIPLWLGLSAALPLTWSPLTIYFGITLILSLIGWTGLARVVRGRFLALREEDFVMAAQVAGASERRIIFRHMVPSFTSHIIASLTLAIPGMILAESALSFLGLGLRPPVNSWGVLLREAQNIRSLGLAPWLMLPALAIVVTVLAFNFFGDGLRDAADPYNS